MSELPLFESHDPELAELASRMFGSGVESKRSRRVLTAAQSKTRAKARAKRKRTKR